MALINCKECGSQISDKADQCPSCGVKRKKQISLFSFLVVLLGLFLIIGLFTNKSRNKLESVKEIQSTAQVSSFDNSEGDVIIASQRLLKNTAFNESSLKFRNITTKKTDKFGLVACGYVNGENRMGGMSGYTRFISNGKTLFMENNKDSTIPFEQMWKEAC